jgi:hypothetical protein
MSISSHDERRNRLDSCAVPGWTLGFGFSEQDVGETLRDATLASHISSYGRAPPANAVVPFAPARYLSTLTTSLSFSFMKVLTETLLRRSHKTTFSNEAHWHARSQSR